MAKKSKSYRLTGKRKVFLKAVKDLEKYFDEHGLVRDKFDSDQLADAIASLYNKAPKTIACDLNTFASIFGSALYALSQIADERCVDDYSETCNGAQAFEAAFFAGFSLGLEAGREDAEDELKGDAK